MTLDEVLERQLFLQRVSARNTDTGFERTYTSGYVCIPESIAKEIVQYLRRAKKPRGRQKRSWNQREINDVLMDKALSHKDTLVSKGETAVNAEIEAAEWIQKGDSRGRNVETIRRDMQRRSGAINRDAKSPI